MVKREHVLGDFVSTSSFLKPEFVVSSAWLSHAPFGFWLVEALRPRVFVELGTYSGFSYLTLCQAVARLEIPSVGYAVDTWEGDEHTGFYGEDVFADLLAYHDPRYSAFSRLVRTTFDDALTHFEDGSIDLLHIDGLHTYESVRHDYDTWLPKLSEHAVVLFHDTNVRERDFGVHRLWAELREDHVGFEFHHGHGLGVLAVGHLPPPPLNALFEAEADPICAAGIRSAYSHLGETVTLTAELDRLRALQQVLETRLSELAAVHETVGAQLEEIHRVRAHEGSLERESERLRQREQDLERHIDAVSADLQRVLGSRGWRLLEQVRRFLRLGGIRRMAKVDAPSLARGDERHWWRGRSGVSTPFWSGPAPSLTPSNAPFVSIVIPVHGNWELTYRCLASIASNTINELVEVIVVDDASEPETSLRLQDVSGIRLVRHDEVGGFVGAANHGASLAAAQYVLFLNNDAEVQPGWLEPLLDAIESGEDVGAVGSKLVYPDGPLQEAGSIIWKDGTGWNYGRGDNPNAPQYNFRRTVDYCSGACLLVRRDLFERLGGFDERYAPAYYEDADLCFALRGLGFRVLYEPDSVVAHIQGASYGADDAPIGMDGRPSDRDQNRAILVAKNRSVFVDKWRDELARQRSPGDAAGWLGGRQDDRLRVLVADTWVPTYDRDAGSLRMAWILRLLRRLDCEVTFFPLNRLDTQPYSNELRALGVEVHVGSMSFEDFARERAGLYDLVVLSRPHVASEFLQHVAVRFPGAVVVYDTVDLHFVREERRLGFRPMERDAGIADAREIELECMRRSDFVATVTEAEAQVVRQFVPDATVIVLPTVHEVRPGRSPYERRADLIFIGGFAHDPNVDGVLYFHNEIWPHLSGRNGRKMWVVGSDPPQEIREIQSPSVVVTGYVRDADDYLDAARVLVVPLRYGAGMKGKIGHALAVGLPVVSTSVGVEGMDLLDGEHVLIADDCEEFARAVERLYEDPLLWQRLSEAGQAVVAERWAPDVMQQRLEKLLQIVRTRVEPVRARPFSEAVEAGLVQ